MIALLNDLKVEKYPDPISPEISHIRVLLTANNTEYSGFGSALGDQVALEKAISELYERICVKELAEAKKVNSSNGFAAHITVQKARNAARTELIERDVIMCMWLAKRAPRWIENEQLTEHQLKFIANFLSHGFKIKFGYFGKVSDVVVCGCIASPTNGQDFGITFSSAGAESITECIDSLILTMHRHITFITTAWPILKPTWNWGTSSITQSQDHMNYYLSRVHLPDIAWLFSTESPFEDSEFHEIKTENIVLNLQTPWPIYIARSYCPDFQEYFVGIPSKSLLNSARLKSYGITDLDKINPLPHPLP